MSSEKTLHHNVSVAANSRISQLSLSVGSEYGRVINSGQDKRLLTDTKTNSTLLQHPLILHAQHDTFKAASGDCVTLNRMNVSVFRTTLLSHWSLSAIDCKKRRGSRKGPSVCV